MPETAMKNYIAPKVVTRLGGVIKPITEEILTAIKEDQKQKARENSKRELAASAPHRGKKRRKMKHAIK